MLLSKEKVSGHRVRPFFFLFSFAYAAKIVTMPGVLSQLLGVLKLFIKS
jgi:hypothetical protein